MRDTDDEGDIFSSGAPAFFLVTAEQVRSARSAAADEEGADTLGRVQLVTGEGEHVDMLEVRSKVDLELAHGLGGVSVEDD